MSFSGWTPCAAPHSRHGSGELDPDIAAIYGIESSDVVSETSEGLTWISWSADDANYLVIGDERPGPFMFIRGSLVYLNRQPSWVVRCTVCVGASPPSTERSGSLVRVPKGTRIRLRPTCPRKGLSGRGLTLGVGSSPRLEPSGGQREAPFGFCGPRPSRTHRGRRAGLSSRLPHAGGHPAEVLARKLGEVGVGDHSVIVISAG